LKICKKKKKVAPNIGDKSTGCCFTAAHLTLPFSPGNFLPKNKMTIVLLTHHFPLFSRLEIKIKGRHIYTIEVIEAESQAVLNILMEHDFQDAFNK
jgi:hypothetical protein